MGARAAWVPFTVAIGLTIGGGGIAGPLAGCDGIPFTRDESEPVLETVVFSPGVVSGLTAPGFTSGDLVGAGSSGAEPAGMLAAELAGITVAGVAFASNRGALLACPLTPA